MGENFWPYGIEPNRKTLETLFRYSHKQGLSNKELTIEELYDSKMNSIDNAPHAKQLVYIKSLDLLKPYYILRRKKKR